ncbi:glutamate receptor-like [Cydia pomonella]|uniref:glutamate receptor-like n=1 Tax=Cydia pomonella TaxID=82600 RepID=UPI002ADD79B3|nr:glutamate receptor-like [Cydia pomonella]
MALNNSQLFINSEFPFIRHMSKIAAKIAFYNFEWRYVTLVMFNNIKLIGLATFLRNYNQTVQLKLGQFIPQRRLASIHQFVLFGQQSSEIAGMIRWLAQNQYDTSGKYVIMCYSIKGEKCADKVIFETLSSVFIVNVLFIKGSLGDKEPTISSYFLVLPEKCLNSDPVKLNISLNCLDDSCFKSAYPEKFSNMYQCPFIVSTFEQHPFMYLSNDSAPQGKDGDLLALVVDILNATLVLKTPKDGNYWGEFVNNNWTGSLGDVFNGVADDAMCSAPLSPDKYANFQISFTYSSMDIVWAAGLPVVKPAWEKLLYPLQINVKMLIFFLFIAIISMNTLTKTRVWRKVIRALKISPPKSNLLFYSWVIFMGLPVIKMPSKPSLLMVIGIWIWFCFIIRTVYQAALISIMKQNIYDEPFDTFEDVLAAKKPFGGIAIYKEYYSDDHFIYDNYIVMNLAEGYQTVDSISNGSSDFVIAMNKDTVYFRLMAYKGSRHLQIIPNKIANSPTVIFFKKFSHLTPPVSRILSASLEGGFSERMYARFFRKGISLLHNSKHQRTEGLRLEHFMGSFFTLLGGYVISIIFFAVEVIFGRTTNSQY